MFSSRKVLRVLSDLSYGFLIIITVVFTGLSCVALLAQAVRHSPTRDWTNNFNALVIGASYAIVVCRATCTLADRASQHCQLIFSLLFCVKRRLAVRMHLARISKAHTLLRRGDVPNVRT